MATSIKRFKSPLSMHVFWHPSFKIGGEIAAYLYSTFSRDISAPLSRGLGIPVYFWSVPAKGTSTTMIPPFADSLANVIVLLIEDYMFDDENWNATVKALIQSRPSSSIIFPIACSKNAFHFEEATLGREQFISVKPKGLDYTPAEIQTVLIEIRSRLLHGICRFELATKKTPIGSTNETPEPVKLFISHAKKDGEVEAQKFRDFIRSNTKLDSFFDTNDIADGYYFDTQIQQAIENGHAALVVFHSDAYASREWCQIEIITAKRYKTPIVVVHNIVKGEARSFPYLGNVPTIKYIDNDFYSIIDLALIQILTNIYQRKYLSQVKSLYAPSGYEGVELTSPPELFNFLDILSQKEKSKGKTFLVLYPDPPLGIEEIKVLDDMNSKIKFLTPLQISAMVK